MKIDWYRLLPGYWYQHSPTDWEWDKILNESLDELKSIKIRPYTATLDGVEVWTSNWPYAYGTWYSYGDLSGMPSVKTRKRLRTVINKAKKNIVADKIQKIRNK